MENEIICPKCGNTNFKLVASNQDQNKLFIYCDKCMKFSNENVVIVYPIKYVEKQLRLFQ